MYGWMGGWMGSLMGACWKMRCGLGGGAGGRGSYSISFRGAARKSLEKDQMGMALQICCHAL